MAEAIARGKPVVATGYSGNLDFMDDESSSSCPTTSSRFRRVGGRTRRVRHGPSRTRCGGSSHASSLGASGRSEGGGRTSCVGLLGRFSPLRRLTSSGAPRRPPNARCDRCARVAARRAPGHPRRSQRSPRNRGGPSRSSGRAADLAPASVPPSSALALLRRPAACRYGRPRCGHLVASLDPGPGTARAPARGLGQARRERAMTEAAQAVNERQSAPP